LKIQGSSATTVKPGVGAQTITSTSTGLTTITDDAATSTTTSIVTGAATGNYAMTVADGVTLVNGASSTGTLSVTATASATLATVTAGTGNITVVGGDAGDDIAVGTLATAGQTFTGSVSDFNVTATTNAQNITTGAGSDTISAGDGADTISSGAGSDTITGGAGADTIDLGAADATGDTVITTGGFGTMDLVSNFLVGATTPDVVQIDRSDLVTASGASTGFNIAGNGATAIGATVAAAGATITNVSAAFDQATVATTTLYSLSSTTAFTTATLATALQTGGSLAITANGAWTANVESFLVAYDDNANTYLAYVTPTANVADDATFSAVTVTNILQLVGVADAATYLTNNFELIA
jgi:Ca2+-binding RTX toxin-like protein